jgi:hypothetical protein
MGFFFCGYDNTSFGPCFVFFSHKYEDMPKQDLNPYRQNLALKREFDLMGLHLAEVFEYTPFDLDLENRRLVHLLDFIKKYRKYGSRETMELIEEEFCFPPIFPDIDPDSDWYRFELWLQGKPTRKTITEQLPRTFTIKNPDDIPEENMENELKKLLKAVWQAGYRISLSDGVPARLVYQQVMEWIGEEMELSGPTGGGWTFDGCDGYCPGCFQRPWCESGLSGCWPEDEDAGKMYLVAKVDGYVSASPQSLEILRKLQAEDDERTKRWEEENENPEFGGEASNEDWKAGLN